MKIRKCNYAKAHENLKMKRYERQKVKIYLMKKN